MGCAMTTNSEPVAALSISSVLGGSTSENRGWVNAIKDIRREVIGLRFGMTSPINADIEFHIPGNLLMPDYEGVRTGSFRKVDSLLKVQVALPAKSPVDARSVLINYIWAAMDAIDAWSITKHRYADTTVLRGLVASLEKPKTE